MKHRHAELVCDCGCVIRGCGADEVAAKAHDHALQAHGMTFTREQLLARIGTTKDERETP